jgi:plastocyanin
MPAAGSRHRAASRAGVGLLATLAVLLVTAAPAGAAVHEHWIAAVPVSWDIAPNGQDAIHHAEIPPERRRLQTVVYRAYTRNWGRRLDGGRPSQTTGLIGPQIRGRVGDRFVIHFRNRDTLRRDPHSMHFHGVHYAFGSDGSYIPGFSGRGAQVPFGRSYTYTFTAGEDSHGVWPYHDHSPSMEISIAGGLYGSMSILGRRQRRADHEFTVFFATFGGFETINGRAHVGNTPVFRARVGQTVQWNVLTGRRVPHLPSPRPPLAAARRDAGGHPDDRAGGELRRALEGGPPRDVAVPLPRRVAHDPGHDRHLPGAPMRGHAGRSLAGAALATLALAAPAAAQDAHGAHVPGASPATPLGAASPVLMRNKLFAPGDTTTVVGDPVTWRNDDNVAHDVAAYDGSFDSGRLEPGTTTQQVFTKQGVVNYHCTLHRFMIARLKVVGIALQVRRAAAPGRAANLTGRAPAGTGTVTFERRLPDGSFAAVASAQPAADGTFTAGVAGDVPTLVRARAGDLSSDELRLAVSPRLELSARRAGTRITLTVGARPAQPGAPVVLQRYRRERFDFRTVATGRLRADSTATFRIRSSHWERFRAATLRGVAGYGSARSRPLAVTVRRSGGHTGHATHEH